MAIVDRMANMSPTYLLAVAQVSTVCHFVHKEPALSCAENPGRTYLSGSILQFCSGAESPDYRQTSTASNGY